MNHGSNLHTFITIIPQNLNTPTVFSWNCSVLLWLSLFLNFCFYLYVFFPPFSFLLPIFFFLSPLPFSFSRLSSNHSPLLAVLFPSSLLSHFYPISNFHFPLMKLDEDHDYVLFPNLNRGQLCAVKF